MAVELLVNDPGLLAGLTVSSPMAVGDTSVTFSGTISGSTGQVHVLVESELLLVQTPATSGTTYTCVRGTEGTTAAPHLAGVAAHVVETAGLIDAIMARLDEQNVFPSPQTMQSGLLVNNPYSFKAHQTAVQTMSGNWDAIHLDHVDWDPSLAWDSVNWKWIAPVSGYYEICASASFNTGGLTLLTYAQVKVNNANPSYYGDASNMPPGYAAQADYNDEIWLNKNDAVQLVGYSSYGAGTTTFTGSHAARMAIHYLSS